MLRAYETVFWPWISDDVRNAVKSCDVSQQFKPAQQKEPLVLHDVAGLPWFKLGVIIFEHRSNHCLHCLLVADFFSKFPIVKKLTRELSSRAENSKSLPRVIDLKRNT